MNEQISCGRPSLSAEYITYRARVISSFARYVQYRSGKKPAELAELFSLGGTESGSRIWNSLIRADKDIGKPGYRIRITPAKYQEMLNTVRELGWDQPVFLWGQYKTRLTAQLLWAEGKSPKPVDMNLPNKMLDSDEFNIKESEKLRLLADIDLLETEKILDIWCMEAQAADLESQAAVLKQKTLQIRGALVC